MQIQVLSVVGTVPYPVVPPHAQVRVRGTPSAVVDDRLRGVDDAMTRFEQSETQVEIFGGGKTGSWS